MRQQTHHSSNSAQADGGASGVAAIILNYNGGRDTVACLHSLLRSTLPPDRIIVVDNASMDDSPALVLQAMREAAAGDTVWDIAVEKPEAVQAFFDEHGQECAAGKLFFIQSAINGGYAAGNNLGIRLALLLGAEAVWLLNNDTRVAPEALEAMRERLFSCKRPGLCGSFIHYMDEPGLVQCLGGGYCSRWTGLSCLCGHRLPVAEAERIPQEEVEAKLNFIYGANVMASRAFIETVGLLDEDFFMYCEEQDWAYRAEGKFDLAYAAKAHVWHKEGASTGWPRRTINFVAIRRLVRSRLLLAQKHRPASLPLVVLGLGYAMVRLIYRKLCCECRHERPEQQG